MLYGWLEAGTRANPVGSAAARCTEFVPRAPGTGLARAGRMVRAASLGLVMALLLASCGGRTLTGGDGSEGSTDDPSGPSADPSDDEQDDGSSPVEGDRPLGDCVLGAMARPAMAEPCPWLAEGRCYESRDMACNCVCPRSKDSQCLSGFEGGPNSRVEVFCQ